MSLGYRRYAKRVKEVHGSNNILIDFKPRRSDSTVYMNAKIDVTNFVKFMDELKENNDYITYFHGIAFIMAKTIYSRPYLNRFVQNRRMFVHNDVSLAFVAKTEFNDESVEYLTVLKFKDDDTIYDVSKTIKEKVDKIRNKKNDGGANDVVDIVGKLPVPIRAFAVGALKWIDKIGYLPQSIIDGNIYYSSAILSNLGTFKVGGIYHNLTNFGTSSMLITFGEIKKEGNKYFMEMGATLDERIADGFYFCKALKLIEYMFENPNVLEEKVSQKVKYKASK